MFDEVVEIKVLNARRVIKDSLIGSFKVQPDWSMPNAGRLHTRICVLLTITSDKCSPPPHPPNFSLGEFVGGGGGGADK